MSFATIIDRQETQLLMPSIISTLRFSKLSQIASHYSELSKEGEG